MAGYRTEKLELLNKLIAKPAPEPHLSRYVEERRRMLAGEEETMNMPDDAWLADTLEDYEEGWFNTKVKWSDNGVEKQYQTSEGRFTKIGKTVTATIIFDVD